NTLIEIADRGAKIGSGLALHCWRVGVLHLEPIGRPAGPIARTQPLRNDALRRGGIFMGSSAFGVCHCARLGPLLPALVAFAATPRDDVGQIFSAVVVSNLGTCLNVLDGAYDDFVAYRVGLGIGPARVVCVAAEVLSARSVNRPTTVDLVKIAASSGFEF